MSAPLRIVIDTNVLVSALLFEHSVPARAVQLAFREHRVLMSVATSSEIQAVLGRSKLSGALSEKVRTEFIKKLQLAAIPIQVVSTFAICRDTRDDKFLQLAIDGEAHGLVTGDGDLLDLNSFRGVRIMTPRAFLDEFEATQTVSKTVPDQ